MEPYMSPSEAYAMANLGSDLDGMFEKGTAAGGVV